ncbi:molybdopterin binding oxidoreductase [Hypoxylon trugodes]|uniref:molybdopterin binding oxidoreductase n=1 Tax=Hypoxylon trugodes TaxID=326681 RepID=UPI00219B8A6B|nr:molybdopterin binding oxidoreductase [Hypoxylon trugodes]KAI1388135.1 molybdopterin binding oxidoreductase [Hypoxylon trugodes]
MQTDIPLREAVHNFQPSDEWKLEQGLAGVELHLLDQTRSKEVDGDIPRWNGEDLSDTKKINYKLASDELPGWNGYVEWEDYPEKKRKAHEILISQEFPPPPEFQLGPIPGTNPVLEGIRWKLWHRAIGGRLAVVPEESWAIVLKEKSPDMLHLLQFPYNGEPPKRLVTAQPITPNPLHFIRNHGGIPSIDPSAWFLRLDGLVKEPKKLTLSDLQDESRFPRMERLVTIQCSGTRRIEQISLYAGEGDEMINAPWAEGAIGTAKYVGVSLKKVIKYCGGLEDDAKHLELVGADTYFKMNEVMNYVISVPYSKIKANEVMLVWEMNGEPLPKIHGAPVRAVVMGYIGARSVKWLYRITAIPEPTRAPVQSREYLYFNQQVGKHNQRWIDGIQIQEMPVSSAIMSPWNKQVVMHEGKIEVQGWAYSGGGRWPERVEVSADGGFSWYAVPIENLSSKHKFAWRTWHMWLPCDVEGWIEIVVRCWDNSLNTQPIEVRNAWNWGLHVTSSAHRIRVYSVNKAKELTRARLEEFEKRGMPFVPITRPTEFPYMTWEEYDEYFKKNGPRDVDK